jgi:serine/threonine-protein kinase
MARSRLPERYRVESSFASGGMSDAVVCLDTHLERRVVIKRLAPGVDTGRILDELAALQEIRSKYVVQIFDVIQDRDGNIEAIVEEYLQGSDLTALPKPTNGEELIRRLYPIAEGIADIHAHDRVHRDIKPSNMKYDAEQFLKIFDFGLSRVDGIDAETLNVIGTRGYMAPELFDIEADGKVHFTTAIDIFAFGSTALRIATGTLPADLLQLPPRLPCGDIDFTNLGYPFPDDLAIILQQCFEVSPSERPTMRTVADLLARHLLKDRHRALIILHGTPYELDAGRRAADISLGSDSLRISYDGFIFRVSNIQGNVSINNKVISDGYEIIGSCVIVLGVGRLITSVTVDIAHPEVT